MATRETIKITSKSRLDVAVAEASGKTRSSVKILVEKGLVLVNGAPPQKCGETVKPGDEVSYVIPDAVEKLEKSDIPVDVVYEDRDVAVINKPQGLVVHPAGGNYTDTLVNALMSRLDSLSGINGELRPGIVHRLDKDTSGVMIVAKNDAAHLSLSTQIAKRTVKKEYLAILEGRLSPREGRIETKIGRSPRDRKIMAVTSDGRTAITEWRVITEFKENCLVLFRILTGRTHQIRVHAKHLGHPVVGDKTYGFKKQRFDLDGQLLHAYRLTVDHPTTGERMTFVAPPPDYFVRVYDALAAKDGLPPFNEDLIL